ncbi:NYN domain-containing protein [Stagnihabitans tardus]|uniref:NYN domain-containing protein n=1 Tax=Stagnihabitans tardus TaxID=2699202 RepID=A0AAE4YAF8_9RHOB|nr:NYN domain-containing protein [Stagnihabitans tardus]NBZ86684.1 NYN domain-containing protein [Stagnihabitans tardus]
MADRTPRLALLIDADNIPARHIGAILEELAAFGEPTVRRVYGDWSSQALGQWKEKARDLGLVMHQQSANTKGKNASDIGLVIDAMDILHAGKVDGFVLVSSDSDFTRLASRIREDGLQVIGVGEAKTPDSLRKVCNRFLLIENFVGNAAPGAEPKDEPRAQERQEPREPRPEKRPALEALPLILDAMQKIDPEGDWYSLGVIGNFLNRLYPDFDPRSFGAPKLSDLVRRLPRFEVDARTPGHLFLRDRS